MAEREKREVHECAVTLSRRRYVPVDPIGWQVMHETNEREVMIAHDPVDLGAVAAFDMDGNFLAWLEPEILTRFAPGDPTTQAQIADSMATRRRLEKGTREIVGAIASAARANGAGENGADLVTQRNPKRSKRQDESTTRSPITPGQAARLFLDQCSVAPKQKTPHNALEPGELTDRLTKILRTRDAQPKLRGPQEGLYPGEAADRLVERLKRRSKVNTGAASTDSTEESRISERLEGCA
jgi:hypothetical protein